MCTHLHLIIQREKPLQKVKGLVEKLLGYPVPLGVEEPDLAASVV